jgi:hypothetical protein
MQTKQNSYSRRGSHGSRGQWWLEAGFTLIRVKASPPLVAFKQDLAQQRPASPYHTLCYKNVLL